MRVDVHLTPELVDELAFRDSTVVVIDVLRATTSIITALRNGAKQVIPAATIEAVAKVSADLAGDASLRCGERNGKMIEGFHLGNSPGEYTQEVVAGKSIVFSSTNGSPALVKGRFARDLFLCGFVNVAAVAAVLAEQGRDFTILCAGNSGRLALEDAVCAGMLLQLMPDQLLESEPRSDAVRVAIALQKSFGKNLLRMLSLSDHGRLLIDIGFRSDLQFCAGIDTVPVVPRLEGTVIRLRPATDGVILRES